MAAVADTRLVRLNECPVSTSTTLYDYSGYINRYVSGSENNQRKSDLISSDFNRFSLVFHDFMSKANSGHDHAGSGGVSQANSGHEEACAI